MKRLKTVAITIFLITGSSVFAQESTVATGGDATGAGGTSSYSVGQVVYTTNTGTNGSVAQGVQQPYEISVTTGVDVETIQLEMVVYPNPTTDYLKLKIDASASLNNQQLSFQLYDIQGKVITTNQVTDNTTTIEMVNYPKGTYFLKVADNSKLVKTFKIIKN